MSTPEAKLFKTLSIESRRYLGNKHRLLPFIIGVVNRECSHIETVADIFAGTGAVSSAFQDKVLITNDIMYSNYICHYAWFGAESYDPQRILNYITRYNQKTVSSENYMTRNFANTYFSKRDCAKIGYIRQDIERNYNKGNLNFREKSLLIASLLYAMDKIAVTCGHYDAYRKGAQFEGSLELSIPLACVLNNPGNRCFNLDANKLVKKIQADLVYIDPPYNSRQYCDTYHLLENVARWEKPEVFGVARKMDRTGLKSKYCTSEAVQAFGDLVENINARYILLSYNNMANKGNNRSNAKISDQDILEILGKKGTVQVFEESYKPFTTGKSHISENAERLFLCTCFSKE